MSWGLTGFQKAYKALEPIAQYLGVVQSTDEDYACKLPEVDNEVPLGIVWNDEQPRAGKNVTVSLDRYAVAIAGATVATGDELILQAGGKVINTTALTSGDTANIIGVAENSGIEGDLITVRIEKKIRPIA